MNIGLRIFAFIQQRDVMIMKRGSPRSSRYACSMCPSLDGGVYVNLEHVSQQECHCVACGQPYLVVFAETTE